MRGGGGRERESLEPTALWRQAGVLSPQPCPTPSRVERWVGGEFRGKGQNSEWAGGGRKGSPQTLYNPPTPFQP